MHHSGLVVLAMFAVVQVIHSSDSKFKDAFFSLANIMHVAANGETDYICCVPLEWQAMMYLDYGHIFYDQNTFFAYINGTVDFAFSYSKKKIYLGAQALEQTPLFPTPEAQNVTILYDFQMGTRYQVVGGDCQKDDLQTEMPRQCIPESAKLISHGKLDRGNLTASTYRFQGDNDEPYHITATVLKHDLSPVSPVICDPIFFEYVFSISRAGAGDVYGLNVLDLGDVRDDSVFNVPSECSPFF